MPNPLQHRVLCRVPLVSTLREDNVAMSIPHLDDPRFNGLAEGEELGLFPAIEIAESPDEFTCTAELPGLARKDVQIKFQRDVLTMTGENKDEPDGGSTSCYAWESPHIAFHRTFSFPPGLRPDKVTAEFNEGVLVVHLPKPSSLAAGLNGTAGKGPA
ncbi:MAG TPA: Hsp20/alpha crystallin family protein [Gemmatimonadaceae bacterium]|nr:Hsp20/alpha crystallin family protein [Gemmatimonadaceae bacterium]